MKLDLRLKRVLIVGLQGSGKTEFARHIARNAERPFIYDPVGQYGDITNGDSYIPDHKEDYSPATVAELNKVLRQVLHSPKPYSTIIIDETNRFCPNKKPMPDMVNYLNDQALHVYGGQGVGLVFVCRRPVQVHTDLAELSHIIVAFTLKGRNDRGYFNDLSDGFGDTVRTLEWHHFAVADMERRITVYPPLKLGT